MKSFACTHCGAHLYFENTSCLECGLRVGFIPSRLSMAAFKPGAAGSWVMAGDPSGSMWKPCSNYHRQNVCNWMLSADMETEFCLSCSLNELIPDLSGEKNRFLWSKMEAAKRRLVYSLLRMRLPVYNKLADPDRGLAFRFLADPEDDFAQSRRVLTGHNGGVITINIAEADDAIREKMRLDMKEVYRTLLGHFRHESGHYYWDRFFADTGQQAPFREVFGDERENYGEALARLNTNGPRPDWQEHTISSYASAHPWEDWSETWAHYLHITDTLETAHHIGIEIRSSSGTESVREPFNRAFDAVVQDWFALSFVLNSLNRSMGVRDPYPFVMSQAVIKKLTFIHEWVRPSTRLEDHKA